jgi:hypothetical protein
MNLRDLTFKPLYNSLKEDVISDFYRPALSCCTFYKRASAYFDSNILSLYAAGLERIVEKKGHVFFVFSNDLPESDFNEMKKGYENRAKIESMLVDKASVQYPSIELKNLAYLIEIGVVDIKIAFTNSGIFHDKLGLVFDGGDVLCFRGSNNETSASAKSNFESFETTCSWNASSREMEKITGAEEEFQSLWDNNFPGTIVMDIPEIVKRKLISYSSGKLIIAGIQKEDCVSFGWSEEQGFYATNNLKEPTFFSEKSRFFANHILPYISKRNGSFISFHSDLSIGKIDAIIGNSIKLGDALNFHVFVDPLLTAYLNTHRLKMENLRNLGIAIKRKSPLLAEEFERFKGELKPLMSRPLMDPQIWGSFHIVNMRRSANFSVPGAGKTATVLGAYAYLSSRGLVDKIVMIGPLNSFRSWKKEFVTCFGDKIPLKEFDYQQQAFASSTDRFDSIVYEGKGKNLILINYEAVPGNVEAINRLVDEKTLLVFDEVHRIKNVSGVRASSALAICRTGKSLYRVVLTGTPIPNGFKDVFNFLNILFTDQYQDYFGYSVTDLARADGDPSFEFEVNDKMFPFFCITTKEDLNVPPADPDDFQTGNCLADKNDERLYEIVRTRCGGESLLMYVRLMQASCNPKLILSKVDPSVFDSFYDPDEKDDLSGDFSDEFEKESGGFVEKYTKEETSFISSFGMSKKFYKGIDIIRSEVSQGHHVIAWAVFIDTLNQIKRELAKKGVTSEVVDGSVSLTDRETILNRFQNNEFDVLIANPATLAESVSLHQNCHVAVYFEYSFNLVHMLQSKDRIHRLGLPQGQHTHFYFLIMDNPEAEYQCIDLRILKKLESKAALQKEAITNDRLVSEPSDLKTEISGLLH